ncbi:PEP-CTERM sorting domain-containing protein [Luteolibacter marinus]|uniref:PEP-CTERM sorting domain-containing protein n=1 Tax=Luteolibacter marinus TaxID=2776705 RepID=UPI001867BA44|nr:PEP-CTERM sorting domain-containing protein [Luteolibacter marinus]
MKTWTTQAELRLADYLHDRAKREGFDGEDAEDLKADLMRHIHEEAEKEMADGIGLIQLEGILGRLDAGYRPVPAMSHPAVPEKRKKEMKPFWLWTWGVVLPLAVLLIEGASVFCGSVFFDPIATWWHAMLVATVPAVNAWILKGAPRGSERGKGLAAGFTVVIAVFYALLFLPLLPLTLIALLFGIGVLSLTPVMAGLWTWRIGRRQRRESHDPAAYRRGWRTGLAAAIVALLVLEGPAVWTRGNLGMAGAGGASERSAIARLRIFHSERVLLRACYESSRSGAMGTDVSGWLRYGWQMLGFDNVSRMARNEDARNVFFRVTGKPFNSLRPPRMMRSESFGRGGDFREMQFDDGLGGDQVAVRIKDLDLAQSRFDGHVDGRSGIGYGEWTMVFHNGSRQAREARCQVLMPRGGRVSRLTLWVNGEPREAAFSSVAKVKAAYKEIAVVQRRDPVLVTMAGPDTLLVQCFPVPAEGEMKIRFGITAALDGGMWEMPRIIERNFGTVDGLEHALWIQGDGKFDVLEKGKADRHSVEDGEGQSMTLSLSPAAVMEGKVVVRTGAVPDAASPEVWCEDKFAEAEERFLIRGPKTLTRGPAGKILLVIDGSAAMREAKDWIVGSVLDDFPEGAFELMLANDDATEISPAQLRKHRFSGGRDNEPALREALRRAKSGEVGAVVWLHGPQSVGLSQAEALLQVIERGARVPEIHAVMAVPGPNRLAETIYRGGALRRGPVLLDPRKDLTAFLKGLESGREEIGWHWRRQATPPSELGAPVWDHLARQWAIEAVDSPLSGVPEAERPALAARYQLVTRVSGAVVLETEEQYKKHGLEPVDDDATPKIPGVPEPSTSLLLLIAGMAAACRRSRRSRTAI